MKRIFLEGLPGAGKSTIIHELEARHKPVTHEMGLVLGVDAFPGNGRNIEEVLAIDDWFIDKEQSRMSGTHGVFDRSYLTHLTYAYGYGKYTGLESFIPTTHKYAEALKIGRLAVPDAIFYLDVKPDLAIERQEIRMKKGVPALDAFWMDKNYLSDLQDAYDQLLSACYDIPIYYFDGGRKMGEVVDSVVNKVDTIFQQEEKHERVIDLGRYILNLEALK